MKRAILTYVAADAVYHIVVKRRLRRHLGIEVHENPHKLTPNDGDSF